MTGPRVILIAEANEGRTHPAILELTGLAKDIDVNGAGEIEWVVIGSGADSVGRKLAGTTGNSVSVFDVPSDVELIGDLVAEILKPYLVKCRPEIVACLHTSCSQDFAGALAIALDAACFAGVQGLATRDGKMLFQCAVFGGKWLSEYETDGRPAVLTVLPGYFSSEARNVPAGRAEHHQIETPSPRIRLIERLTADGEASLQQADTIVAAGRGVGSPENMENIHRLAALLPKSAVAGSRIVCDAGWLPYNRQVGVTGAAVTPELYLACGISGAYQHLAGMSGARFVVAINIDSHAAIFGAADIGVVADLNTFLPLLIEALENESPP